MRPVLAAAIALAAGCNSDGTCAIEDVVTDRVGQQELEVCGELRFDDAPADLTAARDCVIAAQGEMRPYRAQLELVTGPARGAVVFLGLFEGGEWHAYRASQGGEMTVTFSCSSFTVQTPCEPDQLGVDLCLTCENLAIAAQCPEPAPE
jgi:hypothetical protein